MIQLLRKWIKGILHDINQYKVSAESPNVREVIHKYHYYQPDIVIMDITMDKMESTSIKIFSQTIFPGVKVLMCSSLVQQSYIKGMFKNWAKGFYC